MTVLHLGRNSLTDIVWQCTLHKFVYLEEEFLTSMKTHIQYNYSWCIHAFLGLLGGGANAQEQLKLSFHF
jgi:hypothetical protein